MNTVIEAIISNVVAQLPKMYAHMPGMRVVSATDWLGMLCSHPDVFYNAVYETQFLEGNVEQRVEEVLSLYATQSHFPMTWFVTPASQPKNLSTALEARGFKLVFTVPGMFLNLDGFSTAPRTDQAYRIVQVSNVEQLGQWLAPVKECFGLSSAIVDAYYELFKSRGFGQQIPWKLLLGTIEGEPVSAARLFCTGATVGLYNVSTMPEVRGKGCGTAITVAALTAAKNLGCTQAILGSTDLGYNIYRRLGFEEYCQVQTYVNSKQVI